MSYHHRLSALDASFLGIETEHAHMHVGALLVFERGSLGSDGGGVDAERIRDYVEHSLPSTPRYRQRLEYVPGLRHPVWVDDEHFNIEYHVRHTALPRPGDERRLKRLAGRIFSQPLDRARPLWELWIVEGLAGDRFALISKIHHCMIDGIAGAEFLSLLLQPVVTDAPPPGQPFEPRPAPGGAGLLAAEIAYRTRRSVEAVRGARSAMRDVRAWLHDAKDTAAALASTVRTGLKPASPSPLNPRRIGPYRRFDVCSFELDRVKAVKNRLGCTVNDVVLATATGALARFMTRAGSDVGAMTDFRALVPVNIRKHTDPGSGGNKVAMLLAGLPIAETDPARRVEQIHRTTQFLKSESKQIESSELVEHLSDFTAASIVREVFRAAARQRAFNVVITNVPGPPFALYMLGARLVSVYPLVPLFSNQSLGFALFSYAGVLSWGVVGDWHAVPALHEIIGDLEASFAQLCVAAGVEPRERAGAGRAESSH